MPSDAEVKRIWLDMLNWIQRNVAQDSGVGAQTVKATAQPTSTTTKPATLR
jgi:hypothetical protein